MILDNHKSDDFEPGMYQNELGTWHMHIGKTDDNKQNSCTSQKQSNLRCGSRILKWGVNFCNNIIEPKPGWGVWGQYLRDKKKKKEGAQKKGGGGGWKFTHFTSPESAPESFYWP